VKTTTTTFKKHFQKLIYRHFGVLCFA